MAVAVAVAVAVVVAVVKSKRNFPMPLLRPDAQLFWLTIWGARPTPPPPNAHRVLLLSTADRIPARS